MHRRDFLRLAVAGTGLALIPRSSRAADAHIEVLLDEPIAPITPNLYGHFVEHLGGVVYDGIWVGEGSKVANMDGMRRALVDAMRRLPSGPIRWPGGCFADSYDWRDGVGPLVVEAPPHELLGQRHGEPAGRPGEVRAEPVRHERFRAALSVGRSRTVFRRESPQLPARDFYQWVEFCNSPAGSSTLADLRASAGDRDPFRVRFWGCRKRVLGLRRQLHPGRVRDEFRRFTAWLPRYGVDLALIASGPNSGDLSWTRRFLNKLTEKGEGTLHDVWGLALHHYSWNVSRGATTDWNAGKGDAVQFTTDEWDATPERSGPDGDPHHGSLERDGGG